MPIEEELCESYSTAGPDLLQAYQEEAFRQVSVLVICKTLGNYTWFTVIMSGRYSRKELPTRILNRYVVFIYLSAISWGTGRWCG